jgi:multiple sugar transport system substrate-binding protein
MLRSTLAQDGGTLVHWQHHHEARKPVVDQFATTFGEENGVAIDFQSIPYDSYFDKLITALSTGTAPDVFQVPIVMAEQLVTAKAIAPVPDSVMTSDQIASEFVPWTVERWQGDDGKYYGLPTDTQTLLLFINTDLLTESGGDPANPPATWEELKTQARAGTKRDANGTMTQAGLDTRYNWAVYTQAMYSFIDGPVVDAATCTAEYDNEQGIAAWQMVADLMTGPEAVDSPEFLTGQKKFEQGKAVFYINHPVTRGRLALEAPDLNWIVAPAPVPEGKEPTTVGYSWAYVVNAASQNVDLAWRWVQSLTDRDAQMTWNETAGDLPSLTALADDPALATDENARIALESMTYARPVQQVSQTEADAIEVNMWEQIVIQGAPVAEVVEEGAKAESAEVNKILKCS